MFKSSSIASLLWNVRQTIWLVRDSETGAHSTLAHGGRTPMSNVQKGINILCWWCAGPVCSVGWCGCPGQCASVPGGGQSVQCQASASPSPAAVHRQASHHLYHRRQHAHQIITNTSHMCRPSAEHSCINKKSQPEVELRESL